MASEVHTRTRAHTAHHLLQFRQGSRRPRRLEHPRRVTGMAPQLAQRLERFARERNSVTEPILGVLRRDRPPAVVEVDIRPTYLTHLTASLRGENAQFTED